MPGFEEALKKSMEGKKAGVLLSIQELMEVCLVNPACEVKGVDKTTLVLLDAMDECTDRAKLFTAIANLSPRFPAWFKMVISTRLDENLPKMDKFNPQQLREEGKVQC